MNRVTTAVVAGTVAFAATGALTVTGEPGDDQATADAAIAAFTARVTAAGWVSDGPSDAESEAEPEDDELFTACGLDFNVLQIGDVNELEGETARAASDSFIFARPDREAGTTDIFNGIRDIDFVAAFVITVDAEHADDVGTLVDLIGSPETAECVEQSVDEQMSAHAGADTSELPVSEDRFTIDSEADLGVGDASARLHFTIEAEYGGAPYTVDTSVFVARADRALIGLWAGQIGSNAPTSVIDTLALAELTALVEDVRA